jgi:hypothetical protein
MRLAAPSFVRNRSLRQRLLISPLVIIGLIAVASAAMVTALLAAQRNVHNATQKAGPALIALSDLRRDGDRITQAVSDLALGKLSGTTENPGDVAAERITLLGSHWETFQANMLGLPGEQLMQQQLDFRCAGCVCGGTDQADAGGQEGS